MSYQSTRSTSVYQAEYRPTVMSSQQSASDENRTASSIRYWYYCISAVSTYGRARAKERTSARAPGPALPLFLQHRPETALCMVQQGKSKIMQAGDGLYVSVSRYQTFLDYAKHVSSYGAFFYEE